MLCLEVFEYELVVAKLELTGTRISLQNAEIVLQNAEIVLQLETTHILNDNYMNLSIKQPFPILLIGILLIGII